MTYTKADFSPFRDSLYGVGFHWTAETMPREGDAVPFYDAVAAFDVGAFVEQVRETGARYVLFTLTHHHHCLPGPNPEIDRLIAGRTSDRDLPMELADALAEHNIRFALYYNHGIKQTEKGNQDPEWQEAVGSFPPDMSTYFDNFCRLIAWMGEHYGEKLMAWWFDGAPELSARADPPWAKMTEAARAGHPARLVCHNSGIEETGYELFNPCQDYWAGESTSLDFRPEGETTPGGLPWHVFLSWHPARNARGEPKQTRAARWLMDPVSRNVQWPPPDVDRVLKYLKAFQAVGGAVTFNLLCYQDGSVLETDLEVMREVAAAMR